MTLRTFCLYIESEDEWHGANRLQSAGDKTSIFGGEEVYVRAGHVRLTKKASSNELPEAVHFLGKATVTKPWRSNFNITYVEDGVADIFRRHTLTTKELPGANWEHCYDPGTLNIQSEDARNVTDEETEEETARIPRTPKRRSSQRSSQN